MTLPLRESLLGLLVLMTGSARGDSPPRDLEQVARKYECLSHVLDAHQIRVRQYVIEPTGRTLTTEIEVAADGQRWRVSVLHFGPRFATPELARRFDERWNIVVIDSERKVQAWPNRHQIHFYSPATKPSRALDLAEHSTKAFIASALLRPHLAEPLDLFTAQDMRAYRCRWDDLMMPDALRRPGWVEVADLERPTLRHLRRKIVAGVGDDLWLDPTRGQMIVRRELTVGDDSPLVFEYSDLKQIAPDVWLPATCRWTTLGAVREQTIAELQLGPPSPGTFALATPPGVEIIDHRTDRTTFLPSGDEVLEQISQRHRVVYSLPRRAGARASAWWFGLPLLGLLGGGAVAVGWGKPKRRWRNSRLQPAAFTLIEVLVVLAVIAMLIAFLIPAVLAARAAALRTQCQSNLRQIGLALHNYETAFTQLPWGYVEGKDLFHRPSTFVSLLPYLEQGTLTHALNFTLPMNDLANLTVDLARPGVLVCPSDPEAFDPVSAGVGAKYPPSPDPPGGTYPTALTSYAFSYGTLWMVNAGRIDYPASDPFGQMNGCFNNNPAVTLAAISDGLAHTFFAGERATTLVNGGLGDGLPWGPWLVGGTFSTLLRTTFPPNAIRSRTTLAAYSLQTSGFSSLHAGGVHMLMGDGSVRFVSETINCWPIDPTSGYPVGASSDSMGLVGPLPPLGVWQKLTTRAGGEIIANDGF